jgi:hypothetical protein
MSLLLKVHNFIHHIKLTLYTFSLRVSFDKTLILIEGGEVGWLLLLNELMTSKTCVIYNQFIIILKTLIWFILWFFWFLWRDFLFGLRFLIWIIVFLVIVARMRFSDFATALILLSHRFWDTLSNFLDRFLKDWSSIASPYYWLLGLVGVLNLVLFLLLLGFTRSCLYLVECILNHFLCM